MKNIFTYDTDIGYITIVEENNYIVELLFGDNTNNKKDKVIFESSVIKDGYKQLIEYFNGSRKKFDLPIAPKGTEFQLKVWKALLAIPYGETRSYKDIAIAIGNEKASRAVGMANNRNPISIIIPCHRVIGSNGKLVGYGGGLTIKEYLLTLEKNNL